MTAEQMLAIAAQVGYSETAFLTARGADPAEREYDVRYVSPEVEVPFCGHATIAGGVALAERIGAGEILFHVAAGDVRVKTTRDEAGAFVATLRSVVPAIHSLEPFDLELARSRSAGQAQARPGAAAADRLRRRTPPHPRGRNPTTTRRSRLRLRGAEGLGRPSQLLVRIERNQPEIEVSGRAVAIAHPQQHRPNGVSAPGIDASGRSLEGRPMSANEGGAMSRTSGGTSLAAVDCPGHTGARRVPELTASTRELLAWIADRPRTYAEAMDAWRSTCPRLTVWEDALIDGLVRVIRDRAVTGQACVALTARGQAALGAR